MNLATLDHYLREFSPSEQRYKAGHPYTGWDKMKRIKIDGRECRLLKIDTLGSEYMEQKQHMPESDLIMSTTLPSLSIKRNSRFNPVPEHIHAHIEISYMYSGRCLQVVDGHPITLEKNQLLLIDTNCPHSIAALGEDDIMISVLINKDFLRDNVFTQFSKDSVLSHFFINAINEKTNHDHFLLFHSENDRRIPMFFQELFCECYDPSVNSSDIILHLFYTIMAELINVYENEFAKDERFEYNVPIVPMIRYIEKNFRTCTLESVADFFHISPNYVSILLKKYTDLTYMQMIQMQKLKYAENLLKSTDFSITEITHMAGYKNVSFFYKKFQEKYHCSPADYRGKR